MKKKRIHRGMQPWKYNMLFQKMQYANMVEFRSVSHKHDNSILWVWKKLEETQTVIYRSETANDFPLMF